MGDGLSCLRSVKKKGKIEPSKKKIKWAEREMTGRIGGGVGGMRLKAKLLTEDLEGKDREIYMEAERDM